MVEMGACRPNASVASHVSASNHVCIEMDPIRKCRDEAHEDFHQFILLILKNESACKEALLRDESALEEALFRGLSMDKSVFKEYINKTDNCGDTLLHLLLNIERGIEGIQDIKDIKGMSIKKKVDWTDELTSICIKIIKILLKQPGIAVDIQDQYRKTPLELAAQYGLLSVCELLMACGAKEVEKALVLTAENGHKEVCELLLAYLTDRYADRDQVLKAVCKALVAAAKNGHESVCELLLAYLTDRYTDLDQVLEAVCDSLEAAAERGHLPVCELLLAYLFNKEKAFTTSRATIGGCACFLSESIEECLREALSCATSNNHIACCKLLRQYGARESRSSRSILRECGCWALMGFSVFGIGVFLIYNSVLSKLLFSK